MKSEEGRKNNKDDFPEIIELVKDSNAVDVGNLTPFQSYGLCATSLS